MQSWLATLPNGLLDQWIAFDSIEPIGEEREQTAEIVCSIRRLIGVIMATHGVTTTDIRVEDFMPTRFIPEELPKTTPKVKKPKKKEAKAMFQGIAAMLGFGKEVK